MKCPKCKSVQKGTVECESCGVVFSDFYSLLVKKKFDQAVQKYHDHEFDTALEIFNAIVDAKIPKDKGIVIECKKFISLIEGDSVHEGKTCPKCHSPLEEGATECQNCIVIYDPYENPSLSLGNRAIMTNDQVHQSSCVEVTIAHSRLAFFYDAITPTVTINGRAERKAWGTYSFSLPPGEYEVAVSYPWIIDECGKNSVRFLLTAGETKRVCYCARLIRFIPGTISVSALSRPYLYNGEMKTRENRSNNTNQPGKAQLDTVKQSGLGVASFVISLAVGLLMICTLLAAGYLHADHQTGNYQGQKIVGLVIIVLLITDILAIGLGIAALFQAGRKRLLGILGLVFSTTTVISVIALMVLGIWYISKIGKVAAKTPEPMTMGIVQQMNKDTSVVHQPVDPALTNRDELLCEEYARKIADLGYARQKINQSMGNPVQQSKRMVELFNINKQSKEYQEIIESTCPSIGFECETFQSRPEKNVCRPFSIQTNDRFMLKNNTYQ